MKKELLHRHMRWFFFTVLLGLAWGAHAQTIPVKEVHDRLTPTQVDSLMAVLYRYNGDGYYVAPNIPGSKMDSAGKYCRFAEGEEVYALIDNSSKETAVYCLVIGSTGLYISNDTYSISPGRSFISYASLRSMKISSSGFLEVGVGPNSINISGSDFKKKTVIEMLNAVKVAVSR